MTSSCRRLTSMLYQAISSDRLLILPFLKASPEREEFPVRSREPWGELPLGGRMAPQ